MTGSIVTLRDERNSRLHRHLHAWIDAEGNLHIDGHDLGLSAGPFDDPSEHEWFLVYQSVHLAALRELLGIASDQSLLDALETRWSFGNSYALEQLLGESGIPREFVSF